MILWWIQWRPWTRNDRHPRWSYCTDKACERISKSSDPFCSRCMGRPRLNWSHRQPYSDEVLALVEEAIHGVLFPDLGKAFWVQAWVAVALFLLVALSVASGLVLRYRRGRLRWVLRDGALTRLDIRSTVPCLWAIYSIRKSFATRNVPSLRLMFSWSLLCSLRSDGNSLCYPYIRAASGYCRPHLQCPFRSITGRNPRSSYSGIYPYLRECPCIRT